MNVRCQLHPEVAAKHYHPDLGGLCERCLWGLVKIFRDVICMDCGAINKGSQHVCEPERRAAVAARRAMEEGT